MKISLLSLMLIGAALTAIPRPAALADDATAPAPTAPPAGNGAPADAQGQKMERFKEAMAELNLSDAQKDQIKQIRASVTDRQARRQQIMAVLTPDQKAKLLDMLKERRSEAQAGTGAAPAP